MRYHRIVMISALVGGFAALGQSSVTVALDRVASIEFVGSTPCDAGPRQFVGIPVTAACERITWQLALSSDDHTRRPATFTLRAIYGLQAQSAPGFVDGGTEVKLEGAWAIREGTSTEATVYRLTVDRPIRSLEFALVGTNLLHPLNSDNSMMLGNASWSYTLSRTNSVPKPGRILNAVWSASDKSHAVQSPSSSIAGVFEGRTPCQQLARQLRVTVGSDCTKMKWRLTLYQDSATRAPTSYKLEGFVYRNPPRTGKWTVRHAANGGDGTVYELDRSDRGAFLSFFKADENLLFVLNDDGALMVGDLHYSYTLNRTK